MTDRVIHVIAPVTMHLQVYIKAKVLITCTNDAILIFVWRVIVSFFVVAALP